MLKNILRAPALMYGSPTVSATSIRGGHYQLILSSKAYKHKYTGVRTFLSDKERVRNFVTLLDPQERKALLEELSLQEPALQSASQLPPSPIDTDQAHAHDAPTYSQLQALAIHASLPFVGFGFLDNLIMIIAGDYIDLTLGVTLGISTMAAAGLGNALSDVAGVGSAYYVERIADKVGVKAPKLSLVQLQMPRTRWATQIGRAIGVAIGCIIGMFPLLFIPHKVDHSHEATEENNAKSLEKQLVI